MANLVQRSLKTDTNAYFYFNNNQINPGGNIIQQISGSVAYLDDMLG